MEHPMTKSLPLLSLPLLIILMTGCAPKSKPYSAIAAEPQQSAVSLAECEKELQGLKEIDSVKSAELTTKFERMMAGSASYANVRNVVNPGTQNTIDSLYNFQSAKVCAEIRSAMMESLVDKSGAEQ
jgi:PBP1b-binding outer membrane lipoprotein LpoB